MQIVFSVILTVSFSQIRILIIDITKAWTTAHLLLQDFMTEVSTVPSL